MSRPVSAPRSAVATIIRGVDDRVVKKGMQLLLRLGVAPKAFALLETTGWRIGLAQQTPVGNGLVGDTFWLIAARGDAAHDVRNLRHNPTVRAKIGRRWRSGTAEVLPDDDPDQRLADVLAHFGWLRRVDAKALESSIRLLDTTPYVVRINVHEHDPPWLLNHPSRGCATSVPQTPDRARPLPDS